MTFFIRHVQLNSRSSSLVRAQGHVELPRRGANMVYEVISPVEIDQHLSLSIAESYVAHLQKLDHPLKSHQTDTL